MTTTIAVAGKGGTGKTTLAGLLIRRLAEAQAGPILAIDADPASNLNTVLDLPLEKTVGDVREETSEKARANMLEAGIAKNDLLDYEINSSIVEGTNVDLLAMGRPEGPGCYCAANNMLRAIIDTDLGTLTCTLRPDKAPNGVANFVGLARGRRPWKDPKTTKWVKRKFYDGLTFHRVIPDFMAQGGDPLGTGYGGPGYKFADEISDLVHDPGALAYANSGADTNGSQFYITDSAQHGLDGGYTVFGACEPVDVVVKLTHVATDAGDKPVTPLLMNKVTITRCAP